MKKKAQNNSSSSDHYSSVLVAGWVQEGRNYQQLHHRRVEPDHRGDGNQEAESCSCLFLGGTSVKGRTAAAGEEEWAQAESVPRDVLTQITVPGWFPRLLQQHFPPLSGKRQRPWYRTSSQSVSTASCCSILFPVMLFDGRGDQNGNSSSSLITCCFLLT